MKHFVQQYTFLMVSTVTFDFIWIIEVLSKISCTTKALITLLKQVFWYLIYMLYIQQTPLHIKNFKSPHKRILNICFVWKSRILQNMTENIGLIGLSQLTNLYSKNEPCLYLASATLLPSTRSRCGLLNTVYIGSNPASPNTWL